MAIFIPPKGNNQTLSTIKLVEGELVYNTDEKQFFTGDGNTPGGFPIVAKISTEELSAYIKKEADPFFAAVSGQLATKDEIPSIEGLATTDSLSAYAKKEDVPSIEGLATTDSLSAYAKKEDVPSVDEFATKAEVSAAVEGLAKVSDVQEAITEAVDAIEIPSTEGLVSTDEMNAAITEAVNNIEIPSIDGLATVDSLSAYTKKEDVPSIDGLISEEAADEKYIAKNGDTLMVSGNIVDKDSVEHTTYFTVTNKGLIFTSLNDLGSTELVGTEYQDKMFTVNIGINNVVSGFCASAFGKGNKAIGAYSFANGYKTFANAAAAHAEGHNNNANGGYSHAEGQSTVADGSYAHSEGCGVHANGQWSHAEGGEGAEANGNKSHAEGRGKTFGDFSHAEGMYAIASGVCSHAEGNSCQAIGEVSHAEGYSTNVSGTGAHGEGKTTWAGGNYAHAEGEATHADFECSHAEGCYMNTAEAYQHVEGKYGVNAAGYQHVVGGGTADARKNIQTLDWNGNLWNAGNVEATDFIANGVKFSDKVNKNEVSGFLAADEAESKYATKDEFFIDKEYLLSRITRLSKEVDALKREANIVISNTYNPKVVTAENGKITANDNTVDYIVSNETLSSTTNMTVKSLDLDNTNAVIEYAGKDLITVNAKEDVSITNSNIDSVNPEHKSSNICKVTSAEVFKLEGVKFTGTSYNDIMTGQSTTGKYFKYADIINCTFDDICSHVYIWFGAWQDNAVFNVRGCKFKSCEQVFCIGDFHLATGEFNNKLTLNIEDCEIETYEKDPNGADEYEGIMLCDSRNTTADNFDERNPFSKITINFKNVTVGGVKLTKDNFLMGTKTAGQMLYVYRAAGKANFEFSEDTKKYFPTVYVDGELVTQLV